MQESVDPSRENDRNDTELPQCALSITDTVAHIFTLPLTENADPKRLYDRSDKELPTETKSRRETLAPRRVAPITATVDPTRAKVLKETDDAKLAN